MLQTKIIHNSEMSV